MIDEKNMEEVKNLIGQISEDEGKSLVAKLIAADRLAEGIRLYHDIKTSKNGDLCACGSFHESVETAKRVHNMNNEDCELWKIAVNARAAVEAIIGYEDSAGRLAALSFALGLIFTEVTDQSAKDFGVGNSQ